MDQVASGKVVVMGRLRVFGKQSGWDLRMGKISICAEEREQSVGVRGK